jgi:hypothetical protein
VIPEFQGDVFLEEAEAKPKQNIQPSLTREERSQRETVEETNILHSTKPPQKGGKISDEKDTEESKTENEQKLQGLLRCISEEAQQVRQSLMEENKLMNELCTSIRQITKKLSISFNIPPQNIPVKKKAERVVLNEECHLTLVYQKGEAHSAFLAEYRPEIVMAVLWNIMPKLAKVIALYRKKVSKRINFFGKVKRELINIAKIMGGSK